MHSVVIDFVIDRKNIQKVDIQVPVDADEGSLAIKESGQLLIYILRKGYNRLINNRGYNMLPRPINY